MNWTYKQWGSICLTALMLSACMEQPTAPSTAAVLPRRPNAASEPSGEHLGEVAFSCPLMRRNPASLVYNGWQTRRLVIFFPQSELAPDGFSTRLYRYGGYTRQLGPIQLAVCTIPATTAAFRRTDHLFGVKAERTPKGGKADTLIAQTQGCVTDGTTCQLDGIVAEAPPPPPETQPQVQCGALNYGCGASGGDMSFWSGSWDSGWVDPSTGLSPYEQGPALWAICIGAGIAALGGGALTYVTIEQYFDALGGYNSAVLRYQYASPDMATQRYQEMLDAEHQLNLMTVAAAGAVGISAGALLAVIGACSPTVLVPTP